jgi:hypothetical protein
MRFFLFRTLFVVAARHGDWKPPVDAAAALGGRRRRS